MTPEEIVAYYQNLLIVQYKTLSKAVATIGALCTEAVAGMIYDKVQKAYDLETAVGQQLDVLGRYVGVFRRVGGFVPSATYLALPDYGDGPTGFGGFADYDDTADPTDFWKLYTDEAGAYILSDGQMRQLISYVIAVHASDHTNASIDIILEEFFGEYVTLTDNEDMSATYTHQLADPNILFSIIDFLGLLPHPSGVAINVVEV